MIAFNITRDSDVQEAVKLLLDTARYHQILSPERED